LNLGKARLRPLRRFLTRLRSSFEKLRWRLVFALAMAGLLPLLPLAWSVSSAIRTSASALAPESAQNALRAGMEIARFALEQHRQDAENRLKLIADLTSPPPHITGTLPGTILRRGEVLCCKVGQTFYRLEGEEWLPSPGPDFSVDHQFQEMPRSVLVSIDTANLAWYLDSPFDEEFLERAGMMQRASADWALRTIERDRLISSLVTTYLLVYLFAVLLAMAAGILVILPSTRAIVRLTEVAEAIQEGDEARRSNLVASGEAGKLATTFDLMLDRLQASRNKAAEMEKMAAWRELARVLAHEIKNPLTPIQLSVQQLSDSYSGDDERFASLLATTREIVDEEIESLRQLTREFSEFARAPQLTLSEMDPQSLIRDLASLYGERLEVAGSDLSTRVRWDREKLKRALINLLDNGLAASGEKGKMRMTYEVFEGTHSITIEDSGPGIPLENRPKVFEPYFTTKRTGVGLGLPIVRTTCEQHGGSVTLDDSHDLGGARFTIVLPTGAPVTDPQTS